MTDEIEVLHGGVANAGAVMRVGDEVLRPAPPNRATIHRFLGFLAASGHAIAPEPIAVEPDGRERVGFIPGEVPIPPYPAWAQSGGTLASATTLIRALHDASRAFTRQPDDVWNADGADPSGGPLICHNDVCLENVVFRDGVAVALLDFDFAAPGHATHELASFARMTVPIDDDTSRARLGWEVNELPERLRLIADTYRCTAIERAEMLPLLDRGIVGAGEFVRRRVEAGDPGYVAMWESMGGETRIARRLEWWARHRDAFATAMR